MPELGVADWVALATAAAMVGFAKTAVGGLGAVSVALFALVLPARESTGAVLALLLVGDVIAVGLYRRHVEWAHLLRLLPAVVPGLCLGAWFVARADEALMQRAIGLVLLAMVVVQVSVRTRGAGMASIPVRWRGVVRTSAPLAVGVVAGFATMTANAAGPVMMLYLLMAGLPVLALLGTGAWFFFIVNLAKLPFSAGLDLLDRSMLLMDLALVPALVVGAALGALVAHRIPRRRFEELTVGLTVVAAGALLI
ncbi:hypothetical protein ASG88_17840 [Nocardioides sp. Soil777]|uniref:sulfite exporter TauE/SafE family protein n=1 Tax=Nocardioides sp. Soil777 TaxID=1736409 RepID=UPI000703596E|nr:sulfite exporter TauE/SafE family protein [Nocardioides sp. Soil777]KRE98036.1 hypothetical protein ASG88_17840 [Nocardioides sp. Soil777]